MNPQICPYLYYADADAAVDFMTKALGLELESSFRTPEGKIVHAALYVYVDDLEAHLEHARAAGAKIRAEISDKGPDRMYAASDPQGQRWIFAQPK